MRFSLFLNNFSMKSGWRSGRKELKKKHNYLASPCLPAHGFLAFCNNNSGILGRKFWGWAAGGGFHEHQQEQRGLRGPGQDSGADVSARGHFWSARTQRDVCAAPGCWEKLKASQLPSRLRFWTAWICSGGKSIKKKGKRKHINSSVFTRIA